MWMTKIRTQCCFIVHVCALAIFFTLAGYVSALAELVKLIDIRSHYHYGDQKTRIVLEFNQKVDYKENVNSDRITLHMLDVVAVPEVKSKIAVVASDPILAKKIELKELTENKLQLTFLFRPPVESEVFRLSEPNRIIIDLKQTKEIDSIPSKPKELENTLSAPSSEFEKEKNELLKSESDSALPQLVNIRSHYHHKDRKTRVVLKFNGKVAYKEDVDPDYVTLHISNTIIHSNVKQKRAVEVSNSILVKDIKLVELPSNQLKLALLCYASVEPKIFTLAQPERIVIDLLQTDEADFAFPKPAELTTFSVELQSSLPTELVQDGKESSVAEPEETSSIPEIASSVIGEESQSTKENDLFALVEDDDGISKPKEESDLKPDLFIFPRGNDNKDRIQKDPRIRNIPLPVVVQVDAVYDLSQPLTLRQCIAIAKKNSSDIKNAQISEKIEALRVKNAQALYYPDLLLNGGYSASKQIDFGFERNNYSFGVTGRYTIWDHGQRNIGLLQARENKNLVGIQNDQVRQNLVFQVTQAYYEVLKAQELVKVDRQNLDRSRENRERVEAYVEAGIQIEADIATAQVREANSELALLNDQNQLDIALANLPRIMGLNPATRIRVVENKEPKNEVELVDISLDEAINHAIKVRPEFMVGKSNVKQTEYALRLTKLTRYPKLNAQYNHDINLDDYFDDSEDLGHLRYWRFAATLDFPIFDGGVTKRRIDELELQLDRIREDLEDLKRSVALEVQQAYLNLIRAAKSVEISGAQVRDARLSLNVIRERFIQELAILIELLDAQTAFASALTSQVRIFYDYQIAQASLQKVLGDL
tara:strand:- start:1437 stop:3902 length:2466 start_codon:yes stop_codon:yes gene_type:complete